MITNISINTIRSLLNLASQEAGTGPSLAGMIIKAKVIDIDRDGSALLRLLSGNGLTGNSQGTIIKANADVPLAKGQTLFLEILGGKEGVQLKFVGETGGTAQSQKQELPIKLLDLLVQLSGGKFGDDESRQLLGILKSLPQGIKNAFPELKALETSLQNAPRPDSLPLTTAARDLLTLAAQADRGVSIKAGTVVKAEVIESAAKGNIVLRLIASDSGNTNIPGTTIKTNPSVPMIKGQNVYFEILGGSDKIQMRIVKGFQNTAEAPQQTFPVKFLDMFSQLSEARLDNAEFKLLYNMLKSLPPDVKASIPEFQSLEKLLLDIKQLDGKLLKAFVESSGVAFETKVKIAVMNDPGSMLHNLMALQAEGDFKALLLNLRKLLKDQNVVDTLKRAGFKLSELSGTTDNFIKNIEFFQFTSRLNDMFHTFLPVMWDDLRDSEFTFKKDKRNRRGGYTCGINLDLESMGKMSISVMVSDKAYYVTFHAERPEIADLIRTKKHLLEKSFASQGLLLKAVNVDRKDIVFGETQRQGVNVKI